MSYPKRDGGSLGVSWDRDSQATGFIGMVVTTDCIATRLPAMTTAQETH